MLIAYLDESQRDGCYIIGSAVASQSTWEIAAERLSALRSHVSQEYSLPPHTFPDSNFATISSNFSRLSSKLIFSILPPK